MASCTHDNIYVTLLSNNSINIYNNTSSTFTNLLTHPLNLDDNWEVGLSDIFFTLLDKYNRNNKDVIKRKRRNADVQSPDHNVAKIAKNNNNNNKYADIKLKFHELLEASDKSLFNNSKMNNAESALINETPRESVLAQNDTTKTTSQALSNDTTKINKVVGVKVMDKSTNSNIDIHASEVSDENNILTSTNNILNKSLSVFSDNINQYFLKSLLPDINEILFIYTDIIKPRHVGNKKIKCLKIFSVSSLKSYIHFNRVEYFPLEYYNINDISIMIRDDEGNLISLNNQIPVYCTLHFRKCI